MRNANSSLRLVYVCVLLLFTSQSSRAEVERKVTQNTNIEGFQNGHQSVGARYLFSKTIATEQSNSPLSEVQTSKQENKKSTTSWPASEDAGKPVQENSTILKEEATASLISPEMSGTEGSEELDSMETPIAYLNRGRSAPARSHSSARGGSGSDDDDDSGLSRTAIIAVVSSLGGLFVLAFIIFLIHYCNQPYFQYRRRMRKAAQRNAELKVVTPQSSSEKKEATAQDDTSDQTETSL